MNYGELKTAVSAYLGNRTDISSTLLDQAADQVRERINAELRGAGNVVTAAVSVTAGVGTLPADFERAIYLQNSDGDAVSPSTQTDASRYQNTTGNAAVYVVTSQLLTFPASTETLMLTYFAGYTASDIGSDSATIEYPELWIAGMVSQLALYIQNADLSTLWEQRFLRVVDRENAAYQMQQRAIGRSSYDYGTRTPGL